MSPIIVVVVAVAALAIGFGIAYMMNAALLRRKLSGKSFTYIIQPPFIVVGDEDETPP